MTDLMVFYAAIIGTTDPARKLTDVFNRLQRAAAASDRIYQFLDRGLRLRIRKSRLACTAIAAT